MYKIIDQERRKTQEPPVIEQPNETSEGATTQKLQICLPYQGGKGELVTKKMKSYLKNSLPSTETRITFKGSRLSSKFSIKDKIEDNHKHNVVYECKCPDCEASYIGETGRRLEVRTNEHAGKDANSHLLRHAKEIGHAPVNLQSMMIIGSNYANYFKRKLSEALYIKQRNPKLNIQENSVPLLLFN